MLAAFLGGWEIVILLVITGGIGILLVVTLVVVLLANLDKLRAKTPPAMPARGGQPTGQ